MANGSGYILQVGNTLDNSLTVEHVTAELGDFTYGTLGFRFVEDFLRNTEFANFVKRSGDFQVEKLSIRQAQLTTHGFGEYGDAAGVVADNWTVNFGSFGKHLNGAEEAFLEGLIELDYFGCSFGYFLFKILIETFQFLVLLDGQFLQATIFGDEFVLVYRLTDIHSQIIVVPRFGQESGDSTLVDGIHSGFHVGITGQNETNGGGREFPDFCQKNGSLHLRHAVI